MATLHVVAGKAGAGKTTLARQIADSVRAVMICEDEWLLRLADPIQTLGEYLAAASRVRSVIGPLTIDLLRLGTSVVFDFAGNTAADRCWVKTLFQSASADHCLHYVRVDDQTCKARVRQRNLSKPEGFFFGIVTDEQVDAVNRFFVPPAPDEGFTVVVYDQGSGANWRAG
jgi:predicted kinase